MIIISDADVKSVLGFFFLPSITITGDSEDPAKYGFVEKFVSNPRVLEKRRPPTAV